jgi:succinate dehydrogenase / fumarate reductase, membrane anchor subunit
VNGVSQPRPASGVELYAWLFMRISGVALLFLALGHLLIMHLINSVDVIDYRFVAARYATPFWRTYDVVMLWLALVHGLNGARTVVSDYVLSRGLRLAALSLLWLSGFVFLTLGTLVILTFHPILGS